MSVVGVAVIVFLIGLLAMILVPDLKDPETEAADDRAEKLKRQ